MKKSTWFCDLRLRLVFLVLLAVIPALVVIFRGAEQQRSALALEAQQNALRTARLVSANQEVLIAGTRQLLTALANAPVVQNGDPGCSAFFHELLEKYPYYSNLAVANSDGWQTCSALSLPTGPVNIADRAYFRRTIERGDFALGDYQIGRITAKATINAGYPLHDRAGKLIGIVYAGIDLAWLHGVVAKTRLPAGSAVTLVDRNGTIFVRYPDAENTVGQVMPAGALRDAILAQNGEGALDAKGIDGVERLYGFLPLLDGAATVIVGLPKQTVSATADR
ncbi:MAG TPA: cache domain-containing protein, partial [Candidatus Binatia bacterium]|nr:cache domain-containing protein [Candidatus Binatia bacterium]